MQPRCHEFLAGTAFADDEYRFRQWRGTGDVLEHLEEDGRLPDDRLCRSFIGHWYISPYIS